MLPRIFSTMLLPILLVGLLAAPATAILGFGESEKMDEQERQETLERIDDIQQKLKLLQDKLEALERRKAERQAADAAGDEVPAPPPQQSRNWLPVDATTPDPGEFGLYTYLLFVGSPDLPGAVGALEDLILTLETLPGEDQAGGFGNRFLVPVEPSQSSVVLATRPYDYQLSQAYLERLELRFDLPPGPVLVSVQEPLDPYLEGEVPPFLAVSLGRQQPQRTPDLLQTWRAWKQPALPPAGHPLADLFWLVLGEAGTGRVSQHDQRLLLELPTGP